MGAHKECNRDERGNKKMKLKSLAVLFVEAWEDGTKPQREYTNNIVFLTHHTGAHKECNRDERGNKKMKLKSLAVLFVEAWED